MDFTLLVSKAMSSNPLNSTFLDFFQKYVAENSTETVCAQSLAVESIQVPETGHHELGKIVVLIMTSLDF